MPSSMAASLTDPFTETTMPLNTTTSIFAEEQNSLQGLEIFAVVLMSVIIIVAFKGNLFIIIVIFINPQLRSSMANIFIVNLCIVDLLASILAIPLQAVTFVNGEDALSKEWCQVSGFFNTFVMISSMLSLCVISVERFYSISLPMHHAGHATPCLYLCTVLAVWALSLVLALLPLFGVNSYSFRPSRRICTYFLQGDSLSDRAFNVILFIVSFLIPSLILTTMYVGIFKVARKAAMSVGPHLCGVPAAATDTERDSNQAYNNSHTGAIFTISSPETDYRSVRKGHTNKGVPGNGSQDLRTENHNGITQYPEDSGIRTAEVTAVTTKSFSLGNNNVKTSNGTLVRPVTGDRISDKTDCSKLLCVCKRTCIRCITGPSITTLNIKVSDSNLGHVQNLAKTNIPHDSHAMKSLPNSHLASHAPEKLKSSHMKAFKTLMIIVMSYFIFWSPYFVCVMYVLTQGDAMSHDVERIATWLSLASYAVNPCLYGLMNRLIREELSQLLKCMSCLCCSLGNGQCKRPCKKNLDIDEEGNDDICLGGAESFYQFLQRTQASDASPPIQQGSRKGTLILATNDAGTDHIRNNIT